MKIKKWAAVDYIVFTIFFCMFVYLFAQNFVLSENWGVLNLREIDDYALLTSLRHIQDYILQGKWVQVFSFFDYAYGNGFWILNALLLMPFRFFENPQWIIVAGREISLVFGFCCVFLVGAIAERIRPDKNIKYLIMLMVLSTPVFGWWSMKFHVNTQYVAFGLFSLYLLIRKPMLDNKSLWLSAIFGGFSVGFKLTGLLILPILFPIVLYRLVKQSELRPFISFFKYSIILILFSIGSQYSILLALPFYKEQLDIFISTLTLFRKMGTPVDLRPSPLMLFRDGIALLYFHLFTLGILLITFLMLIYEDVKKKNYLSSIIFGGLLVGLAAVTCVVRKDPGYTAAYFMGVGLLMPLGLLGLINARFPKSKVYLFVIGVLLLEIFLHITPRDKIFRKYFTLIKEELVQSKMKAISGIKPLIPLPSKEHPIRVLRDWTAVFPYTAFDEGVSEEFNFWALEARKTFEYDYIVFSVKDWGPMGVNVNEELKYQKVDGLKGLELETATRKILLKEQNFYGKNYDLIYFQNNIEVYRRRK